MDDCWRLRPLVDLDHDAGGIVFPAGVVGRGRQLLAAVLHAHLADRPEIARAFGDEARHLAALSGHPNIIPIVDSRCADDLHMLLLPFVGQDLDLLLREHGPLSRDNALLPFFGPSLAGGQPKPPRIRRRRLDPA